MGIFSWWRGADYAQEREEARKSVSHAKLAFQRAKRSAMERVNEFARDPDGDLESFGKVTQLTGSTAWYQFWERSKGIPSELELYSGETMPWKEVASSSLAEVFAAASDDLTSTDATGNDDLDGGDDIVENDDDENADDAADNTATKAEETKDAQTWSEPKKVFWMGDVLGSSNTSRSTRSVPYVRVQARLDVPARVLLLTQIRASLAGESDPYLVYAREHYRFRGDQTILLHSIRDGPALCATRDFAELLAWEERADGTIVVAAVSIVNVVPRKSIPGVVRAQTRIRGMVIRPLVEEKRTLLGGKSIHSICDVVAVSSVDPRGWAPRWLWNASPRKTLANQLLGAERVAKRLVKEHQADQLVRQHIRNQISEEV
ncbi:Hypothetical Protein FCC1311_000362 [Hondaea fermentalgiana]|uniref:START domain-containing protein n=1 Tax=Hondaea fermentalgiana TaxID=2315210 RepID=A0A2R5FYI0_9STRA|nr:Hypothetical Protein FCC1311_000362 [Hondaea fermentalgiana]|eukprot:GBG23816.1 Hypothetical Protein FCC1311_000362 [Hondaea fermentalgiana]